MYAFFVRIPDRRVESTKNKKVKKILAISQKVVYTPICCDIDSNEARGCCHKAGRFSVERMSSLKTDDKSLYKFRKTIMGWACVEKNLMTHTEMCTVAACRTA